MAKRKTNGRKGSGIRRSRGGGGSGGLIAAGIAVVVALGVGFILMTGDDGEAPRKRAATSRPSPTKAPAEAPVTKTEAPAATRAVDDAAAAKAYEPVKTELVTEAAAPAKVEAPPAPPPPSPFRVKEPESVAAVTARTPQRDRWSWNAPHANVSPTGDIEWAPEKFEYQPGATVRYIDFERGSDNKAGSSQASAWKHHPWDPAATGAARSARGVATYVFKRGVVYRGELVCTESGTADEPIRLTSDPRWGRGEAVICGSEIVTGWQRGGHDKMPDKAKVWHADLDYLTRNLWVTDRAGAIVRMKLARTPNWKVSDPEDVMSEWYTWEQPKWWENKNFVSVKGKKMHLGIDKKVLTGPADMYEGANVRTEWGIVMGTPYPTRIEKYYPDRKAVAFQGVWWGSSAKILTNNRYYIEDKPHFLDEAGEFWVEKRGNGCRVYARMPRDAAPTQFTVEAGRRFNLVQDVAAHKRPKRLDVIGAGGRAALDTTGVKHLRISGLTFRFFNTYWDLVQPAWMHRDVDNAAIRLEGSCDDVVVSNCVFAHVPFAVKIAGINDKVRSGTVAITDNDISYTDHGAINVSKAGPQFDEASILRNKLYMIGLRPYRQSHGHALSAHWIDQLHVAGNVLDRCYGAGLFLFGGKGSGRGGDVPFVREIVHNNKATNTLLAANDWGGIETWQGGPFYVYNNISGNANGYWHWANRGKPGGARLGFAYYLDGGFKNYLFNNIAWGISDDLNSKLPNHTAFYHAQPTINNSYFGNTAYLFCQGSAWSPSGGRNIRIGNVYSHILQKVFAHGKQKEDAKAVYKHYPLETIAYARNVFSKVPQTFGILEGTGAGEMDFEKFKSVAAEKKLLAGDLGVLATEPVLADPAKHDFRPRRGSAAVDAGGKVFVPWALYGMVGEYNFRRNNADPNVILDDHWYMADYVVRREDYRKCPVFNLKGVNLTAESYEDGPLEDWTAGALTFDGESQHAELSHAEMTKAYTYSAGKRGTRTASGSQIKCADIQRTNMLLELYFKTKPGFTKGVVISKMGDAGYELSVNASGSVTLTLRAGGAVSEATCGAKINDGKWHHVVAEVDRQAARATIYVDGAKSFEESVSLGGGASLSNNAPLLVGKGKGGHHFAGSIEFLRICQGTLADASTTIEELYDWQFDGPFLRDFAGRDVVGARRDAGALEYAGN